MRILLWDIDGTLIKSENKSFPSAHSLAIERVIAIKLNIDETLHGATDLEVILHLAKINQIKISKNKFALILDELDCITLQKINKRENSQVLVQPGIRQVLDYLKSNNFSQGILTGNTQKRAQAKLENVDLTSFFSPELFFCGGNFESRIMLAQFVNKKLLDQDVILIGDSPKDIFAAKKNNLKVIGVATGNYSESQLFAGNPNLVISNFKSHKNNFINFINKS
jgi:phosphoglycolate phosphatase